jgi:outer membrane protein assembly factor BamB/tetratricopeptide (TPR) repeat protein
MSRAEVGNSPVRLSLRAAGASGGFSGRGSATALVGVLVAACFAAVRRADAQVLPTTRTSGYELSATIQLDQADRNVVKNLDRIKALLADKQWGEAIDMLCQVMDSAGTKLAAVTDRRFVSVRDWCHLQLVGLPHEALKLYRARVDGQAQKLYEAGKAQNDPRRLTELLDFAYASRWADDALLTLGDLALESGDPAAARAYWEQLLPFAPPPDAPRTWLGVADTDLDLAAVRARLVLASILEGATPRAKDELAKFAKLHPEAKGRLGGPEVNYARALGELLQQSGSWPAGRSDPDWPTFAGSPDRNRRGPRRVDPGDVAWRAPLPAVEGARRGDRHILPTPAIGDDPELPAVFFPIVVGGHVFVGTSASILGFDLATGKPAWGHDRPAVYEDKYSDDVRRKYIPREALGTPRFTLTASEGRLFARIGSVATTRWPDQPAAVGANTLVCLDLSGEGKLLWATASEEGWAFEGAPVADAENVYIAMRRSEVQPQLHVGCFDAQSGEPRWRQFVCAAETPARGTITEITGRLLSLHRDSLYCNTNMGVVAALATGTGRIRWATLYPRVLEGDILHPPPHAARDLTPCLYHRGTLLVAPADTPHILGIDAACGQILWRTGPETADAIHLLGVAGDWLVASGGRLYWISLREGESGRVKHVWPEGAAALGQGRGVLAGDCVYWPTREKIYLFDALSARPVGQIALAPRRLVGGNLVPLAKGLIVATGNELAVLGSENAPPARKPQRTGEVH